MNLQHARLLLSITALTEQLKFNNFDLVSDILNIYGIADINQVLPEIKTKLEKYADVCQREKYITTKINMSAVTGSGRHIWLFEAGRYGLAKRYSVSTIREYFAKYDYYSLEVSLERTYCGDTYYYDFFIPLPNK